MKHPYEEMLQRQQQQEWQAEKDGEVSMAEMVIAGIVLCVVFAAIAGWVE